MDVRIPALEQDRLPVRYTVDDRAFSPPVAWSGVPENSRELALIMETIDTRGRRRFAHWIAWHIDPAWGSLDEGIMSKPEPDAYAGMRQGTADSGKTGYAAPVGTLGHTQRLRLLALDRPLDLPPATDSAAFDRAVRNHVIDQAEQHFQYVRPEH